METHRFSRPNRSVVQLQRLQEADALLYHEILVSKAIMHGWSCYQRVMNRSVLSKGLAVVQFASNWNFMATSQSTSTLQATSQVRMSIVQPLLPVLFVLPSHPPLHWQP